MGLIECNNVGFGSPSDYWARTVRWLETSWLNRPCCVEAVVVAANVVRTAFSKFDASMVFVMMMDEKKPTVWFS
jgi:hypothetical protein